MPSLEDVHLLAKEAHNIGSQAKHDAEKAAMGVSAHEQICAERYARINEKLGDVTRAQGLAAADQKNINYRLETTLSDIKGSLDKARGIGLFFNYASVLVGVVGGVFGLIKVFM